MKGGRLQLARKKRFLELREATGRTIEWCMKEIDLKTDTYYRWQSEDPEFKDASMFLTQQVRKKGGDIIKRPFDAEFRQRYFGLSTPLHLQLSMDLINDLKPGEAGAICLPPEHAKSSISEDFISWKVAHDPNIRILLVSKSAGHSKKLLGRIKRRMTDHTIARDFILDYGPFKSENKELPWHQERIIVHRQTSGERDYTVEAVGVGGQILGTRTDMMLLDDIADPTNQGETDIENQLEWIRLVAYTRVGDAGIMLFIFNRIKEMDVYRRLFDEGFFDKTLIIPAERPEGYLNRWKTSENKRQPVMTEPDPGGYLWPERFTERGYERIKAKVGDRIWELNYQQRDEVSVGAKFPREMVESCFNDQYAPGYIPPGYVVVTGIDPSSVNYTAGVALGINPVTKRRLLIDVWNEKGLVGDGGDIMAGLIQFIIGINQEYKAKLCMLEAQSSFALLGASMELKEALYDNDTRLKTTRTLKLENDDLAIEQLSHLFAHNLIDIPGQKKAHFRPFIEQLVRWRPGDKKIVKDMVKAFQFAELAARQYLKREAEELQYEGPPLPSYLQRKQVVMKTG